MTPFDEIADAQWDRTMAINLRGPFICCQEAVRVMVPRGWGRIISISSVAGKMGSMKSGVDYSASKGGIIALTLCLARRYALVGITANVIAPGTIHSELTGAWDEETRQALVEATPVGHLGQPRDVASAVAFLASEEAGYVTGEVFDVNGGTLMD
jgi:NAD(P)-dependent dehydrogenase (short-subunit alcohol dehydrogenase family)